MPLFKAENASGAHAINNNKSSFITRKTRVILLTTEFVWYKMLNAYTTVKTEFPQIHCGVYKS